MSMSTTQAKEKLSADFRSIMEDVDSLMAATANKAEGDIASLRARILDRLDGAKERVIDAQHEAVERAKKAAEATDNFVHDHPWQAVGVAAAVGVAIGVLIGRR
jgi:ElaB/YqjD/DUF883 family membrane-anchored ribosome-binding protein